MKSNKLDSTFALFDAAETSCVRAFVVTQLCDLVRQSNRDRPLAVSPLTKILNALTERLLLSAESKWELRIAASDALSKVVDAAMERLRPSSNVKEITLSLSPPFNVPSLDKLNVLEFVNSTLPLLAEDTIELPQLPNAPAASTVDAIRNHQLELDKRLGFVLPNQVLDSHVKLTSEDLPDFQLSLTSPPGELANKVNPVRYLEHVGGGRDDDDAVEMVKRVKTEQEDFSSSSSSSSSDCELSIQDCHFLSTELCRLALLFGQNVFNPLWQVRHGALLGLRSLMALAMGPVGASSSSPVIRIKADDSLVQWLATVIFCVIIGDRFADYAAEEVTCPTQETAAQLLVYIAAVLSNKQRYRVIFAKLKDIFVEASLQQWIVLFGALSVLKYAAALSSLQHSHYWQIAELHEMYYKQLDALLNSDSTEDDVRCLACQIITNFLTSSPNLFSPPDLLRTKDAALTYLVENTDAPSSVRCRYLSLLENLFAYDKSLTLTISATSVDSDTCLKKLLSLMSDLIPQTRIAVLRLLGSNQLLSSLQHHSIFYICHRIFSQFLVDPDPVGLREAYSQCWDGLCRHLKFDVDSPFCQSAVELLNKLFCLTMQHTDLGFKPEMFAYPPDEPPRRLWYMGGEAVKNMALAEKHLFLMRLRLQAVTMVVHFVDKCLLLSGEANKLFFEERLGEMLRFFAQLRAGYPLLSFGIFIAKHENLANLPEGCTACLSDKILSVLQDMTFVFDETIPLINLIRELSRQLTDHLRNAQCLKNVQLPEPLLDLAVALISVNVERKPAAVVDTAEQLQSRLRVAIDDYNHLAVNLGRRSRLSLTAAWLSLTSASKILPEKLNPVIQPLMSVLLAPQTAGSSTENPEGEKCAELVELSASSLVDVLLRCHLAGRNPSPETKIVRNVLTQSSVSTLAAVVRMAATLLSEKLFSVFPSLLSLLQNPNAEDEEKSFMVAEYLSPHASEPDFNVLKENVLTRAVEKLTKSSVLSEVSTASKCLAAMAKRSPDQVMAVVLKSLVAGSTNYSQAPVLAATSLCELFADSEALKPYLVPFVRPVLSASVSVPRDCNLHQDTQSRELAAKCMSSLVSMLASGEVINPPSLCSDPELFKAWCQSYDLLRWLRDPSTLPPIDIKSLNGLNKDVTLRHYQSEGVTWLSFLQSNGLHGVLADDLGLGKTLQALCLLALDHQNAKTSKPSLILCPSTLLHHWEYEITKFFANSYLRPLVYAGSTGERRRIGERNSDSGLIVISSYDIFRHDASSFFLSRSWRFCILDEGHVIRNSKSKLFQSLCRLDCSHRLVLTGTPVHNSVVDLWALFEFLMPGYLGSAKDFTAKYAKPIAAAGSPKATERDISLCKERLDSLHRATLPFILRRLKSDVLRELPAKVIQDVFCDMTGMQQEFYSSVMGGAVMKRQAGEIGMLMGGDGEIKHVFQLIRALRLVCNHPCLLKKSEPQLRQSDYSGKFAVLRRLLVDLGILSGDDDSEKGSMDNTSEAGQTQFPSAAAGHRVLLFCQESACLRLIEEVFLTPLAGSLSWLRMDSQQSPAERFQTAVRFNSDPNIDILLLTTRVGGHGLNLTGADTVIFFDSDWNPQADLQAMDRAHRIGQHRTVHVYRLVTRNSIEERVMSLQRFKLNVADSVVNADNANVLESLSASDLYDLVFGSTTGSTSYSSSSSGADYGEEETTSNGARNNNNNNNSTRSGSSTSSRSMKDLMADLGDLWPEDEYSAEFDFSNFLARFSSSQQPKSEPKL